MWILKSFTLSVVWGLIPRYLPPHPSALLQETYDNIPGQNKISFLLHAIRDASAAEEVCPEASKRLSERRVKAQDRGQIFCISDAPLRLVLVNCQLLGTPRLLLSTSAAIFLVLKLEQQQ